MKKIITLIALALLFLAGCAEQNQTVKIGVVGGLTGVGSYFGQQEVRGVELAVKQVNQAGGINGKQIELIVEDGKTDPASAVLAFQKLINAEGVQFVIGDSWTGTTASMVPMANENEVILISPVAVLDSLSEDDFFFRTIPKVGDVMSPLAEYAYNELELREIGMIYTDSAWGIEHTSAFQETFESLGGKITGSEKFDILSVDVRTELTKIGEKNPDGILNLGTSGPNLGIPMRQADELGIEAKWFATFSAENNPLVKEYPVVSSGLTYPYPYDADSDIESVQAFITSFKQEYGELPDNTAANSYDALMLIASAIEEVGEDPVKVKEYLLSVEAYQGGSGILAFDQNGDVQKDILIKQIQEGEFVKLK